MSHKHEHSAPAAGASTAHAPSPDSPFYCTSHPERNVTMDQVYEATGKAPYSTQGSQIRICGFDAAGEELQDGGASNGSATDLCYPHAEGTTDIRLIARRMAQFSGPVAVQVAPVAEGSARWSWVSDVLALIMIAAFFLAPGAVLATTDHMASVKASVLGHKLYDDPIPGCNPFCSGKGCCTRPR